MGLAEPLSVALIGTGQPLQNDVQAALRFSQALGGIVAVCDPVRESADAFAVRDRRPRVL